MKKWIGPFLSFLLIAGLFYIYNPLGQTFSKKEELKEPHIIFAQDAEEGEKKGEPDPHFILILKQLSEKLDQWLKSLNEQIESEDITRFKVRFLEILRNILEWLKEKIDAKIESSEEQKPIKKKGGLFREANLKSPLLLKTG